MSAEDVECVGEDGRVERAKAFVQEQRIDASAAAAGQFDEAEREREAGQERLPAREGLGRAFGPGSPVDDLEAFGESVPVGGELAEELGGDEQQRGGSAGDDEVDELRCG